MVEPADCFHRAIFTCSNVKRSAHVLRVGKSADVGQRNHDSTGPHGRRIDDRQLDEQLSHAGRDARILAQAIRADRLHFGGARAVVFDDGTTAPRCAVVVAAERE